MEGKSFIAAEVLIFKIVLYILQASGLEHLSGAHAKRSSGPPTNDYR